MNPAIESNPAIPLQDTQGNELRVDHGPKAVPLLLASLLGLPPVLGFLYMRIGGFGDASIANLHILVGSALMLGLTIAAALFPFVHLGEIRSVKLATTVGLMVGLATFVLAMAFEAHDKYDALIAGQHTKGGPMEWNYTEKVTAYWRMQGSWSYTNPLNPLGIAPNLFWTTIGFQMLICVLTPGILAGLYVRRQLKEETGQWDFTSGDYTSDEAYGGGTQYVPGQRSRH